MACDPGARSCELICASNAEFRETKCLSLARGDRVCFCLAGRSAGHGSVLSFNDFRVYATLLKKNNKKKKRKEIVLENL